MNTEGLDTIQNDEIEIEDTSSEQDKRIVYPFNPNDIEIETPPFTIGYLIDRLEHGEINMCTDFQREGNLWTEEKQSRLIESILLGLPLPAFYFDTANKEWDIIDGLQRCCSINNFCVKKSLKLNGLEFLAEKDGKQYLEGLGFDDLDRELQRGIVTRPITINLVKKAPRSIRFILFKRLNTGGLELTPQEIRNAVYQGCATDAIKSMAKLPAFIQATGGKIPTSRMQDRDFVSRFVAFYLINYSKYQPSLDDFINRSMDLLEKEDAKDIQNKFERALDLSYKIFREDAFRKRIDASDKRRPINKAYFEVITVLFARLSESEVACLLKNEQVFKNNLLELVRNTRYSNALSRGTGTKDSVSIRFSWFERVLRKSIEGVSIIIDNDNEIKDI